MDTIVWKNLGAMVVLVNAIPASAHGEDPASGVSLMHYLSSPDHLLLLGIVAAGLTLTIAFRRRKVALKSD